LGGEEIPRDLQVACGIAHAQTPKVDDGAEPARSTSRLRGDRSPWIQTGGPCQAGA
jgi:hypothetical protein